ncbi:MAG: LamG-like jellyroll fold domain-containing protein, partial [Pirellulaceae bacterium]
MGLNATVTGDVHLDDVTGSWIMAGALEFGRLTTAGAAQLIVTGGAFRAYTLDGETDFSTTNVSLSIYQGLTLHTTIRPGAASGATYTRFFIQDNQTWTGNGTIVFGANTSNEILSNSGSLALTIDSGLTIRGHQAKFNQLATLTVLGVVGPDVAGGLFNITATNFSNQGTIQTLNGSELRINPNTTQTTTNANLTNATLIGSAYQSTLNGGTWHVGPASILRLYYNTTAVSAVEIHRLNAHLILDGADSRVLGGSPSLGYAAHNALESLSAIDGNGRLTVTGGRAFVPATNFVNAGQLDIDAGSTFGATDTRPAAGLISHYEANGNANDSAGPRHGTVAGGAGYAAGRLGSGFALDGVDDYVTIPDEPALRPSSVTVAAWVDFQSTTTPPKMIVAKPVGSSTGDSFALWYAGTFRAAITDAAGTTDEISFAQTADPFDWHHVAMTFDDVADTLTLYYDGVARATRTSTRTIAYDTKPLLIGADINGGTTGQFFPGVIDEVRLYDRALTAAEIHALYENFADVTYTQTAGATRVDGLLSPALGVTLTGGRLGGAGTVAADVQNAGATLSPGNSPELLDITGNYVQGPDATLLLELAGRDPDVPQFDRLRVTGTASLAGTLRVELLNEFEPTPGDTFPVVSSALRSGQFDQLQLPAPGGPGRELAPVYTAQGLTLLARSVPPVEFEFVTTQTHLASNSFSQHDVVLDSAGNAYVTGYFADSADLDGGGPAAPLTTTGITAAYVAKFDPTGALLWQRQLDGTLAAEAWGLGIALDPTNSDVVFTGRVTHNVAITDGTTTATLLGDANSRPFVVRLTSSGNVLWGRSTAHAGLVTGHGNAIAVGASGVSYIAGSFSGTVDFDTSATDASLTATGASWDAFLWALDSGGGFVAVERLGSEGDDAAEAVGVWRQGGTDRVWVAGSFQDATNGLAALSPAISNVDDAFVLSAEVSGTSFAATYAQSYGGPGFDYATDLAVGGDGAVVVVGSFEHTVDFDVAPDRAFTLASSGDTDGFVLKLASDGQFVWARAVGGYRFDVAQTVALDPHNNVYVGGVFEDFVDFDPLESSQVAFASDLQAFVARYTASGQLGWVTDLSSTAGAVSQAAGVAVGADGRVVAVGDADLAGGGTIDFDPGTGVQNPFLAGETRGFVWSLQQKAIPVAEILGLPAATPNEGDILALSARVTDSDSDYFTYAWAVRRDGADYAAGNGSTLAFYLADQGNYTVDLTVLDESGNTDRRSALVRVSNAAPIFHATEFGAAVALGGGTAAAGDGLGTALASGGGFVLAGEPGEDIGAAAGAGSVTVYDAATGGIVRSLVAPAAEAGAQFGAAVAVVGPYGVVGAPGSTGGGRVYVFRLADGGLVQSFASPAGGAADRFGAALTAVGNLIAIGAPGRAVAGLANVGAAYLFDPASGEQLRSYANPTPQAQDEFGLALTPVGGGLLIGAPGDDSTGLDAGAAYLLDAGSGQLLAALTNPHPTFPGSRFASVLASTGFTAVVGAPLDDSAATDAGGVYVYNLDPASGRLGELLKTLRNPNSGAGRFGGALAARGQRVLIGAATDNQTVANSGTAFLFDIDPQSPTFGTSRATLKKATPAGADQFGAAAIFVEDDIFVAAPSDDSMNVDGGRIYQFDAQSFVSLSAPSVTESGHLKLTGSFFDPGAEDSHSVLVDWDSWSDGAPLERINLPAGTRTFTLDHQYLDDNPLLTPLDLAAIRINVSDRTDDLLVVDRLAGPDAVRRYDGTTGASGGIVVDPTNLITVEDATGAAVGVNGQLYVAMRSAIGSTTEVHRYDLATGAHLASFPIASANLVPAIQTIATGLDRVLYVLNTATHVVERYDDETGQPVPPPFPLASNSIFGNPGLEAVGTLPRGIVVGPDGQLYLSRAANLFGTDYSSITKYDIVTGQPVETFLNNSEGLPVNPSDLLFDPDGSSLYVLADSFITGRAIFEYSFDTKELQRTVELGRATGPDHFTLDANDDLLWSDGGTVVKKFDGETGELISAFAPQGLTATGYLVSAPPQDSTGTGVAVVNAAPTVTVRAAPSLAAGQYTLEALAQDIGTRDNLTFSWTITGGTPVGSTSSRSFTFTPTGASVSVLLTVADDDSGIVTTRTQVVIGTAGNDAITVNNGNAVVNGTNINYAASTNRVVVFGLGGDDTINGAGASTMPMELIGGFGNDTLTGGSQDDILIGNNPGDYALANPYTGDVGNDSLAGGAGNDTIDGGLGNDTMIGGNGNDYYVEVPGSADLLDESTSTTTGIDTIDYQLAFSGIVFSLSKTGLPQIVNPQDPLLEQHTVEIRGSFENLYGSTFDDSLTGSLAANSLRGGEGDDRLFGGDLEDSVTGGLALEDGNDSLAGGLGDDTALGGTGDDVIFGGDEFDTMLGSTGISDNDSLAGGSGDDTLLGGTGDDVIFGGDELDTMLGNTGIDDDDSIAGGFGDDTLLGGTGDDIIFGGDEFDTMLGNTGIDDDSIAGGLGDDTLLGGTGDDIIFGGDELDTMRGNTGIDDDSIAGGLGDDTLLGGTGDDIIFGGDELDTMLGNTGIDDD